MQYENELSIVIL